MVGTTIQYKEHTWRTVTGYIPSAIRNTHHDHSLHPLEWSVLYTGVYNAQVHTMGNAHKPP